MSEPTLPEKVVTIDALRIARGVAKRCRCTKRTFVVDEANREVTCGKCGARVDAFDALREIAYDGEALVRETEALLRQRREIAAYQPHLVVFRSLERQYRGKKMLPACPECGRAFYFEQIIAWTNREIEEARRKRDGKAVPL